jgi:translocation and assembly module TamB
MRISRGNIFFQNNEFDVRRGSISFDDPTRIDPHLDIEAMTEIRRTSDLSSLNWRVTLRLTGSSDNLRLTTESDPDLPQPDILMLLAFGMTRAELQQLQVGDVGSVAALEALSSATGLDRAIQNALPLIDDVRLTTGYSTRTGRTEPRLSVGKRLAERVRLSATTGLGEGREFRGALEWQLDDNMRVGLSYDNYNIDSANSFGNLGVDWGYRLEFE